MANLEISLSVIPSPLTRPVLDGKVTPEGVTIQANEAQSVDANSRRMLELGFDVAEMSLATFIKAREQGVPIVALPLFTGRRFLQPSLTVSPKAGIKDPSELRGKRVGLPQFWMTSSVWHRLVLRQMHGVRQEEVHWVTTAPERMGALGMPPGVDVRQDTTGRNARDLLLAGEVDAMMQGRAGPARGEPGEPVSPFPDLVAAQRDYYRKTGMFPIMHLLTIKQELAAKEPWLVESLCDAFTRAKEQGRGEALEDPREAPVAGGTAADSRALLGDDPWPYGIKPSRHVLEIFLKDVLDQGLIQRPLAVEDLFTPSLPERYR